MKVTKVPAVLEDLKAQGFTQASQGKATFTQERGGQQLVVHYINIDTLPAVGVLGQPGFKSIRDFILEHSSNSSSSRPITVFRDLLWDVSNENFGEGLKFRIKSYWDSSQSSTIAKLVKQDGTQVGSTITIPDARLVTRDTYANVYLSGIKIPDDNISGSHTNYVDIFGYETYDIDATVDYSIVSSNTVLDGFINVVFEMVEV